MLATERTQIEATEVLGCSVAAESRFFKMTGTVSIGQQYLNSLAQVEKDTEVFNHIEKQIKYLIGISKNYQTSNLRKFSLSPYRGNLKIIHQKTATMQIPELDAFWGQNISVGHDPYMKWLMEQSRKKIEVSLYEYEVEIYISSCGEQGYIFDQSKFAESLSKFPVPLDSYLGFWINDSSERTTYSEHQGRIVPNCLSKDLLVYTTYPDYAWYYWQLGQKGVDLNCYKTRKELVTFFKFSNIESSPEKNVSQFLPNQKSYNIGIVLGQNRTRTQVSSYVYSDELLNKIKNTFEFCKTQVLSVCLSQWDKVSKLSEEDYDLRLESTLQNLKFLFTYLKEVQYKKIKNGSDYFILSVSGLTKDSSKKANIEIYYGRTGNSPQESNNIEYWSFIYRQLMTSDAMFYVGHAGVGRNFKTESILNKKNSELKLKPRKSDLVLGIFNCESHSYFGYDLLPIFDAKSDHRMTLLSSTGVGTQSLYITTVLEGLLTNQSADVIKKRLARLVETKDFLVIQNIMTRKKVL